jgi:hypothetical protein
MKFRMGVIVAVWLTFVTTALWLGNYLIAAGYTCLTIYLAWVEWRRK